MKADIINTRSPGSNEELTLFFKSSGLGLNKVSKIALPMINPSSVSGGCSFVI